MNGCVSDPGKLFYLIDRAANFNNSPDDFDLSIEIMSSCEILYFV
jgi:hypothetical protein